MMQSALSKERREQKMLQREQEMDSVPKNVTKNWIDPLPDSKSHSFLITIALHNSFQKCSDDSRQLASNMRGIGLTAQDVPEWKKHVIGGKKSSFGMKTNLSLLEQRQSLPIYKLKDELIKVILYLYIIVLLINCTFCMILQ